MPTVAIVDGVKIQLYVREHPPPHFHAVYAEYRAQIEIASCRVIKGRLPHAKLNAVLTWAISHREALNQAWELVLASKDPGKIDE